MKHYYVRHGRRVNGNNTAATAALHCLSVCLHPPTTLAWRGKREGERRLERRGKDGRWNWCAVSECASLPNKAAEKEGETNALSAASLKRRHIGGVALLPPSRSPMPLRRHSDRKTVGNGQFANDRTIGEREVSSFGRRQHKFDTNQIALFE